jgi:hypothetical protein
MAANSFRFEHRGKVIEWTAETPASEIERLLPEIIGDRGYAATRADVAKAQRWLAGDQTVRAEVMQQFIETIDAQENEMAEATNAPQSAGLEALRARNKIMSTVEGRIAIERWRTGQDLNAQQQRLVDDYQAYEKTYADAADAAKPKEAPGGWMKTARPHYISPELYRIEAIQDPRERVHAIRALRSEWRDNPKSAFNDVNHGDHKSAVEWLQRLYQAEQELGPQPEDPE